jgi:hypothetical protein
MQNFFSSKDSTKTKTLKKAFFFSEVLKAGFSGVANLRNCKNLLALYLYYEI